MLDLKILYEDKNFLAVNKPAGVLVHPTKISDEETIVSWLLKNRPEVNGVGDEPILRPGIVHRLDKGTSGVLLIAKTQKYFEYLKSLYQAHEIKKTYLAVVYGGVLNDGGRINKPIGLKSGTTKRTVMIKNAKMVKEAVTNYKIKIRVVLDGSGVEQKYTVLEVSPETGRTHQIRVHLASIGHPVVGDPIYGGKRSKGGGPLYLHAYAIKFPVSSGQILQIEADPPKWFEAFLK